MLLWLFPNKYDNLDEPDTFLGKYERQKLVEKETVNLNRDDYLETWLFKDLHCAGFGPSSLSEEFCQTFKNLYLS